MATKLLQILAVPVIAGGISAGCIAEDCADTYFLDTPQVLIENDLDGRVRDIKLELKTDQRPYVPPEHRGIPVGTNLSIYCAPLDRHGRAIRNDCKDSKEYEFFVDYIDAEGKLYPVYDESRGGFDSSLLQEVELEGRIDSAFLRCTIWSPECATAGYVVDENGRMVFKPTEYRQRTMVGQATAEIITEQLCPAPIPYARPVSEDEWRPSSED